MYHLTIGSLCERPLVCDIISVATQVYCKDAQSVLYPPAIPTAAPCGGAWPFLVGGVICLVNSDNERDLNLLNSQAGFRWSPAS